MRKIFNILMAVIIFAISLPGVHVSAVSALKINYKTATIGVNETYTLITNANPTKTVKWMSSNKTVATVNKNGKVTGKRTGKTTITASVDGVKAICYVTVKSAPDKISAKALTVNTGTTVQIKATLPKNTASKTLTYKSSNTQIARVNSKGTVTGVKTGNCIITVSTYNDKSVEIKVTVAEKENLNKALVVYFSVPETTNPNNMTTEEANSTVVIDGKVLGNTQYVANLIQENTNADIFRIEPKIPYTTNHSKLVDLAKEEQENNARPELAENIENISQYNVIFLGYPNWWGDMPMILYTFLESYDLSGKTIIPFNTHGGSGFSDTINTIVKLQPKATVKRNGFTVSRNNVAKCEDDLIEWLRNLNLLN